MTSQRKVSRNVSGKASVGVEESRIDQRREQQQQPQSSWKSEVRGCEYAVPQIAEILQKHGVHKGHPEKRLALARRLEGEVSFSESACDLLYREFRDTRRDPNPGFQLTQAFENGYWLDILVDVEAERVAPRGDHDHGTAIMAHNAKLAADQERGYLAPMRAVEMVLHEGRSLEDVAKALETDEDGARELLRNGCEIYGYPDPEAAARLLALPDLKAFSKLVNG